MFKGEMHYMIEFSSILFYPRIRIKISGGREKKKIGPIFTFSIKKKKK